MFYVINKEKVYSYVVTLGVIGVLFTVALVYPQDTIETYSRNVNNNIENSINNIIV